MITGFSLFLIFPPSCTKEGVNIALDGQVINVTPLHTSDWHSRLLPYYMTVNQTDTGLGLKQANGPFGGAARGAFILKREKAKADRVLHLDSGDIFQGAPIFNFFRGEAEMRVLSALGCDAAVIGNHEFDLGSDNLADQVQRWANFPMLAVNYYFEDPKSVNIPPLGKVAVPFTIFNLKGLKVAVIGVGNTSSMGSIYETGNKHGITPMETVETIQFFVDLLKPQSDLIVILSHLGLDEDEKMIRGTTGIDLVLGGHLHITLNPPKILEDCQTEEVKKAKDCVPRRIVLAHSGAFLKYVARLDVAVKQSEEDPDDWEIISHSYQLFPVDSTVPENQYVAEILEPYVDKMKQLIDLDLILGYSPGTLKRFSNTDGDSELGNLVATAIWTRPGIETDFALTNTNGIRDNIYPGPVTLDSMYQVFPFDNTISTVFMSGREVIELFDYAARRTAARGCNSQAQIAGARVVLKCGDCRESDLAKRPANWPMPNPGACALSIKIGGKDIDPDMQYSLATNNYIAK
ncbi:MAG: bifunctional metallophosphatase/5'-nucleotidase, partial [Deltaproteobacteria bacterium]|nr:bifunctional metallophosphatase/5'-nucleotidase [Deltaproteobacteria bacterium]